MKKVILVTIALVMVSSAFGVDYVWNAPTGGSILDGTKWNPNGVPGETDSATILNGYTVTLNGYWNPSNAVMGLDAVGLGDLVFVQIYPNGIIECNSMTIAGIMATEVMSQGYIDAGALLTLGNGSPNAELEISNEGELVVDKISHSNVYLDRAKQLIVTIRGSSEPGGGAAGFELYELLFQEKVTTRGGNLRLENATVYTDEVDYIKVVIGSGAAIYPLDHVLGDLDNDNDVDLADFAIFSSNWLVGAPVQQQASAPIVGGEELSATVSEESVDVAEENPITITEEPVILIEEVPVEEVPAELTPEQELQETLKAIESVQEFLDDLRSQAAEQKELLE